MYNNKNRKFFYILIEADNIQQKYIAIIVLQMILIYHILKMATHMIIPLWNHSTLL